MAKNVQKQSNARFVGVLVLVAVAGVATLGYLIAQPRAGIRPVDPNLAPGTAEGYLAGNPNAPVQVIEFGDFECPACGQWSAVTEPDVRARLISTGQISFRFYDFPLDMHRNTWPASNAAACAADQGKFWEMHDQLFATQDQWNGEATRDPTKVLQRLARSIGLDMEKWQQCFDSQVHYPRIKANQEEALRRGINQTPTFIIGSTVYPGAVPFDQFRRAVEDEAAKGARQTTPTAPARPQSKKNPF